LVQFVSNILFVSLARAKISWSVCILKRCSD
jgi:hypothetical protein